MIKLLISSIFVLLITILSPSKLVWLIGAIFTVVLILFGLIENLVIFDQIYLGYLISFNRVSYYLIILSVWIRLVIILSRFKIIKADEFRMWFNFFVSVLILVLIFTFSTNNRLIFYFFFEASLIPTLIIIMGWGYQPERLQAGVYFLFYTLTASLPLLLTILFAGLNLSSFMFYV